MQLIHAIPIRQGSELGVGRAQAGCGPLRFCFKPLKLCLEQIDSRVMRDKKVLLHPQRSPPPAVRQLPILKAGFFNENQLKPLAKVLAKALSGPDLGTCARIFCKNESNKCSGA